MLQERQREHEWLDQLVGEWTVESRCQMDAQEPACVTSGRMLCRSLGGFWVLAESSGKTADGNPWQMVMSLGFDPKRGRYIGSFIGSMMAHQWLYDGQLDDATGKLVLDTSGPDFEMKGMVPYQDVIEVRNADHWILTGQIRRDDGTWHVFTTIEHRRVTPGAANGKPRRELESA